MHSVWLLQVLNNNHNFYSFMRKININVNVHLNILYITIKNVFNMNSPADESEYNRTTYYNII